MNKIFIHFFMVFLFAALCTPSASFAEGKGFYPDGQLKWEYLFQDGQISEAKWYNEAGQLVTREVYVDGQAETTEGYRPDGSLEWQTRKLQDNRQEVTRFDEAGQKTALYQTLDNQPDGEYTAFYADGAPKQTVTYQMGILEGPAKTYFPHDGSILPGGPGWYDNDALEAGLQDSAEVAPGAPLIIRKGNGTPQTTMWIPPLPYSL